jgi:rhodanese-related sulfurtransferase
MAFKLIFAPDGKILGAQIVGIDGVDKRIDVIATALRAGMTAFDLEELELGYAPPYGSARDPVNVVGMVASNILRGDVQTIDWDDVSDVDSATDYILDVRNPYELAIGQLEGAHNIPLPQLRRRMAEIPHGRRIVVYCAAGQRAYFACRALNQHGYETVNLTGGYKTYSHAIGRQSNFDIFDYGD